MSCSNNTNNRDDRAILNYSNSIVQKVKAAFSSLTEGVCESGPRKHRTFTRWMKLVKRGIRIIQRALKRDEIGARSVVECQSLTANLTYLKDVLEHLKAIDKKKSNNPVECGSGDRSGFAAGCSNSVADQNKGHHSIVQYCKSIVKKLYQARPLLTENNGPRVYQTRLRWLRLIKISVRLIQRALRCDEISTIGDRKCLTANLGYLKSVEIHLKSLSSVGAGGVRAGLKRDVTRSERKQKTESKVSDRVEWQEMRSAFKTRIRSGIIVNKRHRDPEQFFDDCSKMVIRRVTNAIKIHSVLKVNTVFCAVFQKALSDDGAGTPIEDFKCFSTKNFVVDAGVNLQSWFSENVRGEILNQLSEFEHEGSNWTLNEIVNLEINFNKYIIGNGYRGSSYIRLPSEIARKSACVNIMNLDSQCFLWSVSLAFCDRPMDYHLHPTEALEQYKTLLNSEGLEFPMTLPQINKFEVMNPTISVNVYGLEPSFGKLRKPYLEVVPVRLSKSKRAKHVNLLLIQNVYHPKSGALGEHCTDTTEIKYHYCYINDLPKLVNSQISGCNSKKIICETCLNYFSSETKFTEHVETCQSVNQCKISFPENDHVEFKNHVYKQQTPFVVYADFESLLRPHNQTNCNATPIRTNKYQLHIPYSAGYYLHCSFDNSLSRYKYHRGPDAVKWFADQMEEVAQFISSKFKNILPMTENFKLPTEKCRHRCHICEVTFTPDDIVVRDHNHFDGSYRGMAHRGCNLNFRKKYIVPVVLHNLSGYDSHFIIKEISSREGNVDIIPINKERYISFTKHDAKTQIKFRYIDSLRFLNSSLDVLVSTLKKDNLNILKREFSHVRGEAFNLLTSKGVFCYDYIDSLDKLNQTNLPPIEDFYNKLNNEHLNEERYRHAQNVWNTFKIKDLGQYADLYLKCDILLLADVFENFRKSARANYGLDPTWYFTLPGYSFDCMLKYTKCKLEIPKSVDLVLFIEKAIRGGVSVCSNRYAEANNKYTTGVPYDPKALSSYILYLDANNLYGWAMNQYLPCGGFSFLEKDDVTNFDVTSIPDEGPEGYILEVDIEYPRELHDMHRDLPFCPESKVPPGSKLKKLMTTLYNKSNYIIHYRNLKQALAHGLRVTKVHKVLKFKQSPWLKPYVELNTRLRANAKTVFEQNLYKLSTNAIFGKTMENVRLRRVVKIKTRWESRYGASNLISSPLFSSCTIFGEDLVAIELRKAKLIFDKPIYVGMAILDISKTCIYKFHYDYILPKFGVDKCSLLYTDTDSLIYQLYCDDVYAELIKRGSEQFDTSNYDIHNPYGIVRQHHKVPGLMKDEAGGKIITHFVGLRSKMYSFKIQGHGGGDTTKKIAKGVKQNVVRNQIMFKDYVDCLRSNKLTEVQQRTIRSYGHDLYSIEQRKIALSANDDKRYLIPGSTRTLPWGHHSIMN